MPLSRRTLLGAAALALPAAHAQAQQAWPSRPITMVVPFAAGGPTDVIARIVGDHMGRTLGQQVVIENVAGAGGTTGITRAAGSAADGYTIMMGHMGTHGAAPALYPKLKYDPAADFSPIGLAAGTPIVLVARKDFPAADLKAMAEYVRANAAKMNMAHAGVGSVSHTTAVLFLSAIGAKPTLVAYRGTGPALNDLMAGTVDFMTDQIVNVAPQIEAGTVRAYAIATPERSARAAQHAHHAGSRPAGLPGERVERGVRTQEHARPCDGQAERSAGGRAGRRGDAQAPAGPGRRDPGPRRTVAGGVAGAGGERGGALDAGAEGGGGCGELREALAGAAVGGPCGPHGGPNWDAGLLG